MNAPTAVATPSPAQYRPAGALDLATALAPYSGPWNDRLAAHLLRRAGFGGSPADVARVAGGSMHAAVDALVRFDASALPPGPDLQDERYSAQDRMLLRQQQVGANSDRIALVKKQINQLRAKNRVAAQLWWLDRMIATPTPLQEKLTLFWHGHFTSSWEKGTTTQAMIDQNQLFRRSALGNIRDLTLAVSQDPAMLRYLDNEQNAAGHINENYAREIMELHTLGVGGGYSQHDVQELARILTGVGVNMTPNEPKVPDKLRPLYVRAQLFEFNPARHDFGDKEFLGRHIKGSGMAEVEEAVTQLARAPATAQFICHKLAVYFVSDDPPPELVARMAATFTRTDGDIAAVLDTLFESREFTASLGGKFKDPVHYVVSAVRLAYDTKPLLNAQPMINWLNRMGEPLYAHETPDGYALAQGAWASSGQMTTRFEIAKAIGTGSAGLFKTDGPQPIEQAAFPQLSNALYYSAIEHTLKPATRSALDTASSPQEWNMYLLAAPEFMQR